VGAIPKAWHGSAQEDIGGDILRCLAAVMVMFHHYGFWVWAFPDGVSARATGGIPPHPDMSFAGSARDSVKR
jgi:peptidoglycan/LPS O-acetylase OafA/YrhL